MDISLGVSMTPKAVRMVLVEGENAKGVTVDHDVFEVASDGTSATAPERVLSAILGTRESAEEGGHRLVSTVVAWRNHDDAAALRDALGACNIDDVMLISELHAASALAEAVGTAMGYERTALIFVDADTATLSVVETADGSIIRVQEVDTSDEGALATLTSAVAGLEHLDAPPQGVFVVGSGAGVSMIKEQLAGATFLPVSAPDEPELALARGAALAGPRAPLFEASTIGRAYARDDDGSMTVTVHPAPGSSASVLAYSEVDADEEPLLLDAGEAEPATGAASRQERKPFLVGSAMTGVFVVGVAALVVSLAVSIRPTVDQQPSPAQSVIAPTQAPAPAAAVPAATAPPPETIQAPVPVVQEARQPQAPVHTVYVEAPAARIPAPAPAPAPAAPAPAPAAPAPAPAPAAAVPVPVVLAPEPVAPAPVLPAPAAPPVVVPNLPAPVIIPRAPVIRWPWDRNPQQQIPQQQSPQQQVPQRPILQNPRQMPQWVPPKLDLPDWDPPQQKWPDWTPQQKWPQQSESGRGSGGFNPGSGGNDSGSRGGSSPVWPWQNWGQ